MSGDDAPNLPTIDFETFVLSLSQAAMVHLGVAEDPETRVTRVDLSLAKQNIDILGLLEDKTRGNLTGSEERLLSQVLFNLRLRYVDLKKAEPASTKEN